MHDSRAASAFAAAMTRDEEKYVALEKLSFSWTFRTFVENHKIVEREPTQREGMQILVERKAHEQMVSQVSIGKSGEAALKGSMEEAVKDTRW